MAETSAIRRGRPPTRPSTDFSRYLLKLMYSREVYGGATELAAMMTDEERDYSISKQSISLYLAGSTRPQHDFGVRLAEVLDLNEEEKRELAWKFLFGQERD